MKASILTALLWAPCCVIISKPASIPKHYQRRTALTPEQGPTFMLHKGTDKALSLEKGNSPIPVSGIKHGLSLFGFPQILWITPGLTQSNRVTAEAGSSYNDLIQRLLVPQHFEHLSEKLENSSIAQQGSTMGVSSQRGHRQKTPRQHSMKPHSLRLCRQDCCAGQCEGPGTPVLLPPYPQALREEKQQNKMWFSLCQL